MHDKIKFLDIEKIIKNYLDEEYSNSNPSIDEILALNEEIQRKILNEFGVDFNDSFKYNCIYICNWNYYFDS